MIVPCYYDILIFLYYIHLHLLTFWSPNMIDQSYENSFLELIRPGLQLMELGSFKKVLVAFKTMFQDMITTGFINSVGLLNQ